MKVTKKNIIQAVSEKFGINPEYIEIEKCDGEYSWFGKCAAMFSETSTYVRYLNDWPLERWVEDFEMKLDEWKEYRDGDDKDINQAIENTNWEV